MSPELRPDVTLAQVGAFLADHLGAEPRDLRALKPGELSRVYAYDLAERPFVVRFNTAPDSFEADRVAHERFAGPGLPIPRVLEIGRFGQLHFAISERLPGRIMWDITAEEYDRALPALLDVHDRIAAIDPGPEFGSQPWPTFLDAFAREHDEPGFWHGWRDLFDTSFLERDLWEGLYARFRTLLAAAHDPGRLVHGDFGYDNVLVDGPRVTAVLDWGNNRRGDPLWDLAYISFWLPRIEPALAARYGDAPDRAARVELYHLRMALDGLRFYARTNARPAYDRTKELAAAL
jgi:hygromycin-B 4-O-kinase